MQSWADLMVRGFLVFLRLSFMIWRNRCQMQMRCEMHPKLFEHKLIAQRHTSVKGLSADNYAVTLDFAYTFTEMIVRQSRTILS